MKKKGMTQALTIVVAAVVLIVVSLVVITIATSILGEYGTSQKRTLLDATNQQSITTAEVYCRTQCLMGNKGATTTINIKDISGKITTEPVVCSTTGTYYKLQSVCNKKAAGEGCTFDDDCTSGTCTANKCA